MSSDEKKIVLVYPKDEIREIIVMILESEFECEILEVERIEEAKKLIEKDKNISVILSEYCLSGGVGSEIFEKNIKQQNVPFVFISKTDIPKDQLLVNFRESNQGNEKVRIPFDHEHLVEIINNAIHPEENIPEVQNAEINTETSKSEDKANIEDSKPKSYRREKLEEHFRVKVSRLKNQSELIGDIYVKLNESKMVRIAYRADGVNKAKLEQLEKKGVHFVYFSRKDYDDFIRSKIDNLLNQWKDGHLEGDELLGLQLNSMEQVRGFASSIGIPGPVLELTEKVADSVMNELHKEVKMNQFLDSIKSKKNYFFQLSQIVNYLCTTICTQMKWEDETQATKLIYASMFCDIALVNSKLAAINSINDQDFKALDITHQDAVTGHMIKAVEIVEKSNLPVNELDKIIFYHHERPDGSGFPQGLTAERIPPIAAAFIIPYDLAQRILRKGDRGEEVNILHLLDEIEPTYKIGHFASILTALRNGLS